MEGRQRRSFTTTRSRLAVDLVASSGPSIGSVAKELGLRDLSFAALGGTTWDRAGADGGGAAPHNASDAAVGGPRGEIARLQRENERLRMERDILKKLIAIFAGGPK